MLYSQARCNRARILIEEIRNFMLVDIEQNQSLLEKWFPLQGVLAQSLKKFYVRVNVFFPASISSMLKLL